MRVLSISILFLWTMALYSQSNFSVEVIDNTNGLSSDKINFIFQDSDGCMWFGTDYGLNQYNGYEIKVYKGTPSSEGFKDVVFQCMEEDDEGNLWIGTQHTGLYIFNKYLNTITPFKISDNKQRKNSIIDLLFDSNNNMWIATLDYGLYKFNIKTENLTIYESGNNSENFTQSDVLDMVEGENGEIWFATWDEHLIRYIPESNSFVRYTNKDFKTYSLLYDSKGVLWIGTWNNGLLRVDSIADSTVKFTTFRYSSKKNTISADIIYGISEDADNNIWLSTPSGFDILYFI